MDVNEEFPQSSLDITRRALEKELSENGENGWENLSRKMYGFFKNRNCRDKITMDLSWVTLYDDCFDSPICADFYMMLDRFDLLNYSNFEACMTSDDFMLLAFSLYGSYKWMEDELFLESSDGGIYNIKKKAAITESQVFEDVIKCTDGGGKIPVGVSGDVLSKVIDFMKMEFSFIGELDRYKNSILDFLKNNQNILHDLYQVAEYLKISSLSNLTSLVFCHNRSKADTIWESRNDFSNFFKSFQNGYRGCVKGFVNAKNAVISDLYQAANLADIPSLLESTLHPLEGLRRRTLDDMLDCYTKLTFV